MHTAHTAPQSEYLPATRDIREAFAHEVAALGGTVPDVHDDGERFLARAVLPEDAEVRPGDRIRAGVAVRVAGPVAMVHPYTFRQVCSNGAIAAHALQSFRVARVERTPELDEEYETMVVLAEFRVAVRMCAAPEAFARVADELRSAAETEADFALHVMPSLARLPQHLIDQVLQMILHRFEVGGDRSAFGLVNAVTSVARDTRDPDDRWRLEELGGTMPARLLPKPKGTAPAPALAGAWTAEPSVTSATDWGAH